MKSAISTNGSKAKHGLHIVKGSCKTVDRWHVYAWRGGPRIHTQDHKKPVPNRELMLLASKALTEAKANVHTLGRLLRDYKGSPEFKRLSDNTKTDYLRSLDRIDDKFGKAPLGAFEDRRMRGRIIEWRDEWFEQPRTADKLSVMIGTLLHWGVERGRLGVNVAQGIPLLHSVDRSDIIWQDSDWEEVGKKASQHLMDALELASLTGLRLSDLVALTWNHVGEKSIIIVTRKRKKRVVIPILPDLKTLLDRLAGDGEREGHVLKNSRGKPWTSSGLGTTYQKSKGNAQVTIHDLRGTYVTWLCMQGLTDEEIHRIIGWSLPRINEMRARYVDEARVVVSLIERLADRSVRATVNGV